MSIDLHSLLAPYALDALDADERATFEHHLHQCETCQDELPGLVATLDRVAEAASETPPPALRSSVLAAISTTPQLRPVVALDQRRRLRRSLPQLVAAAAVVAAFAGGGFALVERDHVQDMRADQSRVSAVLAASDASTSSDSVSTGGTVRVISSKIRGASVVTGSSLKALPDDRVYQLWTMRNGDPTPAGFLRGTDGMAYVASTGDVDAVAVTVEPRGGSERPTSDPIAVSTVGA